MMRMSSLAALLLSSVVASAATDELSVGDAAPPLAIKEFVKGQPVQSLEKGKIYVVEFTKIGCPPCRTAIPHLTELQKKYSAVIFIAVHTVAEPKPEEVKQFVEKMGDKMDYRVALDDTAVGERKGLGGKWWLGKMENTWLNAAGQNSATPTVFIVNGEGKVAWIGHPMAMDKPLDKMVTGAWDLAVATKEYKDQKIASKYRMQVWGQAAKALRKDGNPKKAVAILDRTFADNPKLERGSLRLLKFEALVQLAGGNRQALEYGKRLMADVVQDEDETFYLERIASDVVGPYSKAKPDAVLIQFALQAALRADEIAKNLNDEAEASSIAETLARAYFLNGDAAKAVATQERAIQLAAKSPLSVLGSGWEKHLESMKKPLEQYKKAAQKKSTPPTSSI